MRNGNGIYPVSTLADAHAIHALCAAVPLTAPLAEAALALTGRAV